MPFDFWSVYWAAVAFIFGAIVGSFLNVCIWRIPRGESLVAPPSRCPSCEHQLHLLPDMVPILSQLWYRSRCRYCGAGFSWRYAWVEFLTGCLFLAVYLGFHGDPWRFYPLLLWVSTLVVIFFIDLDHYQIPDSMVFVGVLAGIVADVGGIITGRTQLWNLVPGTNQLLPIPPSVAGAVTGFLLLWTLAAVASALMGKEAMGAGDSFLLASMGANLIPLSHLGVAFMLALALGTVSGITLLLMANRAAEPEAAAAPAAAAEVEVPIAVGGEGMAGSPDTGIVLAETATPVSPDDGDEPEIPALPPESRIGRLLTVTGVWSIVFGAWWLIRAYGQNDLLVGGGIALVAAVVGVALIVNGTRRWLKGDETWAPEADAFFEDDPGPRVIPFGPYLVVGSIIALFFGEWIITWYLTLFGVGTGGGG